MLSVNIASFPKKYQSTGNNLPTLSPYKDFYFLCNKKPTALPQWVRFTAVV
jgi:hypothetical protein